MALFGENTLKKGRKTRKKCATRFTIDFAGDSDYFDPTNSAKNVDDLGKSLEQ